MDEDLDLLDEFVENVDVHEPEQDQEAGGDGAANYAADLAILLLVSLLPSSQIRTRYLKAPNFFDTAEAVAATTTEVTMTMLRGRAQMRLHEKIAADNAARIGEATKGTRRTTNIPNV